MRAYLVRGAILENLIQRLRRCNPEQPTERHVPQTCTSRRLSGCRSDRGRLLDRFIGLSTLHTSCRIAIADDEIERVEEDRPRLDAIW